MKRLLFSLVAMMIATVSFAQNLLVATLSHGDVVTNFYGASAFQKAMEAAEDGDLINISGGTFLSTDITKAVTIHGTGLQDDLHTALANNFSVSVPATGVARLTVEGVEVANRMTITDSTHFASFMKCKIGETYLALNAQANFINCDALNLNMSGNATAQFVGCYLTNPNFEENSGTDCLNCVVVPAYSTYDCHANRLHRSTFFNCVIVDNASYNFDYYTIPVTSTAQNCISVGGGNPFTTSTGTSNISGVAKSIFIDSNQHNDLTDEAKAQYLGADGTPVGMYGGTFPYNPIPSYPRITKFNVAPKTTTEGKLDVEVVVSH